MTTTDDDREILDAVAAAHGATIAAVRSLGVEPTSRGEIRGHLATFGLPDGREERHHLYIETAPGPEDQEGVLRMRGPDGEDHAVWLYPRDPALPALAAAAHPDGAQVLLGRLGIDAPRRPDVAVVSYRPRRRAAVRVRTTRATIYLKVVAPRHARRIFERHALWRDAGVPAPAATAWSGEGLVAIAPLPGVPAADAVARIPDPTAFAAELERLRGIIARIDSPELARASLADRLDWYRTQLTRRRPDAEARIRDVVAAIGRRRETAAPAHPVTVHGDLHLSQVFVDGAGPHLPTGILDLDTGGWGDPADDDAALCAHLVAMVVREEAAGRDADGARRMLEAIRAALPPDRARRERGAAIEATHLLGHALSGALPIDDALELASRRATDPDENPLMPVFPESHPPTRS